MKEFPSIMSPENIPMFSKVRYNRLLCYLRKSIYEHVISNDENDYYDFGKFCTDNFGNNSEMKEKMINTIQSELRTLGWNCKLSFGGTGLFIYSTDSPPSNCWDDGL